MQIFSSFKLDATGAIQWSKTIGGTGSDFWVFCHYKTADNAFAVGAVQTSFGGQCQAVTIFTSLSWMQAVHMSGGLTAGGTANDGGSIIQTSDGGYAAAGYTSSFLVQGIRICTYSS